MDVVTRFDYDDRPILSTANVEATANDTEVGGSMVDTEERKTVQKKTLWALSSPIHQAYNYVRRRSLPDLESSVRSHHGKFRPRRETTCTLPSGHPSSLIYKQI
ncbi:hypothetical protein PHLGIDRAFT_152434 [Phlebiopsis gigantea 11061_1 CR5-6]|uniref:Uncharacterized protein n=1 Tax=Phlebiopsis gigantea (strain 11061_1 CR5-6) TaxID=745531 RepID=A0A0C3S563_PHLG1|nr:hypothetical protein PHLGIDRAFT_152434 [Phlebiopsis gigantea 11061_1 CR5-6]